MSLADDPEIQILARLSALEHVAAVQWHTFTLGEAAKNGMTAVDAAAGYKLAVCGPLLDGWKGVPLEARELVRAHVTRIMDHAGAMAALSDGLAQSGDIGGE